MLDTVGWDTKSLVINDVHFSLEETHGGDPRYDADCFMLYKNVRTLDQYRQLWKARPSFRPQTILELGMWDGGSVALWFEYFQPRALAAIDIAKRANSPYLERYLECHGSQIKTFWNTDQADTAKLHEIVANYLGGAVDLVIDDASHLYDQTKKSFETLFPLLSPGGLYIIEDWSWACWSNLPVGFLPVGQELPRLIDEIVNATGSVERTFVTVDGVRRMEPLIANTTVYPELVVIERGNADTASAGGFELDKYVTASPQLQASASSKVTAQGRSWLRRWRRS